MIGSTISVNVYKVAGYSALGMVVFFLLMKLMGLVTVVELRFFNFFIMFLGIRYALLQSRRLNDGKLEYLRGMLTGFLTAFFTSVFFAAFLVLYLMIDSPFMNYLKVTQPFGSYLSPGSAALVTIIEGIAAGAIVSFAMMHLYNRDSDNG